MPSGAGQQVPDAGDQRFAAAYHAFRSDPAVQFTLAKVQPPPRLPGWVTALGRIVRAVFRPIGRLLVWLDGLLPDAPYARIAFWMLIAAGAGAILWLIVTRLRSGAWRLPFRRKAAATASRDEEIWVPEAGPARVWLEEAEALAARGDYAEAAHHLLRRSVEDIRRRRPRAIAPALTSRDIAASTIIPPGARSLFAAIAEVVECSLFGGRPVDAREWEQCRAAYAGFALPRTWSA